MGPSSKTGDGNEEVPLQEVRCPTVTQTSRTLPSSIARGPLVRVQKRPVSTSVTGRKGGRRRGPSGPYAGKAPPRPSVETPVWRDPGRGNTLGRVKGYGSRGEETRRSRRGVPTKEC